MLHRGGQLSTSLATRILSPGERVPLPSEHPASQDSYALCRFTSHHAARGLYWGQDLLLQPTAPGPVALAYELTPTVHNSLDTYCEHLRIVAIIKNLLIQKAGRSFVRDIQVPLLRNSNPALLFLLFFTQKKCNNVSICFQTELPRSPGSYLLSGKVKARGSGVAPGIPSLAPPCWLGH